MVSMLLAVIYLAFVSLGLPDSLLGSAWPTMYHEMNVPVSYSGIIFFVISACTVVSSLQSDRLTKRFGAGIVTAVSIAMTAAALFGFSLSHSFAVLLIWAVPYGLGAGSVDAALNNFVALHFASRHMSWLHSMWGVGASIGPYIMSEAVTRGGSWNQGYRIISIIQVVLSAIVIFSLPLWKKMEKNEADAKKDGTEAEKGESQNSAASPIPLRDIFKMQGAKEIMLSFFCYCAVEQTVGLWASSFLVLQKGVSNGLAASFASLFYIGITIGRMINGFLTIKFSDSQLIRAGQAIIFTGIVLLLIPGGDIMALAGFVAVGLGCAPIYPCIIHSTPKHFGREKSQAIVGVQMAAAYVGTSLMPPLFGMLARHIGIFLLPFYLLILLAVQFIMYNKVCRISGK